MKKFALAAAAVCAALTVCLTGCKENRQIEPISQSAFLLNTFVTVTLYDSEDQDILTGCLKLCGEYENMLSRTIEGSDIYRLNHREPGTKAMEVQEETAELIEKGLYYSKLSEGAFDITIEPLSSQWDFTAENPQVPDERSLEEGARKVDYRQLHVEGNQVIFQSDDTRIDLGAIAKGYIADKLKDYLLEENVKSAVINLGGNVLCVGEKPDGQPFRIGLRKPFEGQDQVIGVLDISDRSMVTSGVYERHFVKDGVNYHHILDPKTGYPYNNGLTSVTIVSEQSVDGDGLSTVCFSLGLEKALQLVESLDQVYAVFITEDGKIHTSKGAEQFLEELP